MESDKSSWIKWPLVFAIGTPVALGLGYYYYTNKRGSSVAKNDDSENKNEKTTVDASTDPCKNIVTIENVAEDTPAKIETPLERAVSLKNSGNTFFKNKKYEDAIRCYSEAIEICPPNELTNLATFYQNRAAAYEQMQNFQGVANDCTAALKFDGKYLKALHRRAKAYEHLGSLKLSLEDITTCCMLESFQNQTSIYTADRILHKLGKEHARDAIINRKPVKLSKHFVKGYFGSFSNDPIVNSLTNEINGYAIEEEQLRGLAKAKRLLQKEQYDEVIDACTEELNSFSGNGRISYEALLLKATMLFLVGDQQNSLKDFNTLIEGDCNDVKIKVNALIKRASLHLQLETPELFAISERMALSAQRPENFIPENCMADFMAAETVDPNNSDIYHHRGQVYLLMDKMDLALADFEKAMQKNATFPVVRVQTYYAQYKLAVASGNMAVVSQCIDGFKEVMKEHPDCIEAYTLFIQICTDQREYEKADDYFKKAIKVQPKNATVRVQRATLYLQWQGNVEKAVGMIEEAIKLDDRCELGFETLGSIEVQRGNLKKAVDLFEKALLLAKSERELAHIYSLKDAAEAQAIVVERLGFINNIH